MNLYRRNNNTLRSKLQGISLIDAHRLQGGASRYLLLISELSGKLDCFRYMPLNSAPRCVYARHASDQRVCLMVIYSCLLKTVNYKPAL